METYSGTQCSNLSDYILNTINRYGNDIAQINSETGKAITFNEISNKSKQFAHQLVRNGIKHGDVICIISKNTISYSWTLIGALHSGATCALLSPALKPRELEHALNISKPKLVIATGLQQEQITAIKKIESVKNILAENSFMSSPQTDNTYANTESWNGLCCSDIHDTALLLSSSGSTGLPKGVMITHNNVIWALLNSNSWFSQGAKALGLMPFYHAYGLILMLMALCEGAQMVTMSGFNMANFLENLKEYQITHLHIVPSLLASISKCESTSRGYLKTVKHIWTGAGKINSKHQETVLNKLGNDLNLYHSYGMTETTFVTCVGKFRNDKSESCGKLVNFIKAKIISHDQQPLKSGELGEICFQGPTIMKGYLGNDKATRETIDENGWLHSGDLGYFDGDGYLYVVDRIKELIKYQGFQISPSEIESVLLLHNGVAEAAVIGYPHSTYGEIPQAFVVKNQTNVTEEELTALVQKELSSYKQLRGGIHFVDFIPKTPSGKILRKELKKVFLQ